MEQLLVVKLTLAELLDAVEEYIRNVHGAVGPSRIGCRMLPNNGDPSENAVEMSFGDK